MSLWDVPLWDVRRVLNLLVAPNDGRDRYGSWNSSSLGHRCRSKRAGAVNPGIRMGRVSIARSVTVLACRHPISPGLECLMNR